MYFYHKPYRKGILAAALMLLGMTALHAQTNYIKTRTPNRAITRNGKLDTLSTNRDSVQTTIQYIDGLGRPLQTVQRQASPTFKDIVQPFAYDQYGREALKYLPYATTATGDGSYKTDALTAGAGVAKFYHPAGSTGTQQTNGIPNTLFPYAQTGFEASPLNRVIEQGAPGAAWQTGATPDANSSSHSSRIVYTTNDQTAFSTTNITTNNGSRRVMIYRAIINANQSRTLSRGVNSTVEYYDAGQLYVTISRNENWQPGEGCFGTTEEYKDKEGHVIVKRTYNLKKTYSGGVETQTAEMLSTYYVYDDLGNLCFVVPPAANPDVISSAQSQSTIDYRCYQYRYDERNRLVQKKIPGKGWEYIIYNKLDQPVATQDSVQRMKTAGQQWTITKYDAMGRVVLTGIYQQSGTTAGVDYHASLQAIADTTGAQWETRLSTSNGYTANTWPKNWLTTLSLNYYDSYQGIPGFPAAYNQTSNAAYSRQTTGLLTASKTLVLNSTDTLWTVPYYDDEGKTVRTFSQHYVGGSTTKSIYNYDDVQTTYNFLKLPTQVKRLHYLKNAGGTAATLTLTETNYINYDHMGRKRRTQHQMRDGSNASQTTIPLVQSDYNEIGQLKVKHVHSINNGTNWLQNIDYRYNARGWLSNINNANLTADGGITSSDTNDQFGEELSYDDATSASRQYNGNIATVQWKSAPYVAGGTTVTPVKQTYDYGYDHLNRLRAAVSTSSTAKDNFYGENVTYDNMGNISSLGRYDNIGGTKTQIDTLAYTYSFYRVNQVDDASTYTGTAGFTELVKQASEYIYDGNGNQLRDQNKGISGITYNLLNLPQTITKNDGSTVVYVYSAGGNKLRKLYTAGGTTTTTEYDNGIEYDNSVTNVAFIQTEEGRARHSGTTYTYEYDLKDHLGNTRVTLTPDPNDPTQQTAKILQENDYYAFGYGIQSMQGIVASPKNEYLYNHKELQEETGLYDYGARFYDPVIGRWTSVDPLADMYQHWSPYNYGIGNPIKNIDPDGRDVFENNNPGLATRYVDPTGRTILNTNDGRNDIYKVPWNMYTLFMNSVNNAGGYGSGPSDVDSKKWNDYWRNSLPQVASETQLNIAGYGYLRSEDARDAQAKYLTTGNSSDYYDFLTAQRNDWGDPASNIIGIFTLLSGIVDMVPLHVEDVMDNPNLLRGKSPKKVEGDVGGTTSWRIEKLGKGSKKGQGWVFREYFGNGQATGRVIRWHPGGGHHGPDPYWKVSNGSSISGEIRPAPSN
ncbi:DUF6443 domain-containing protein [Mucilaginibacter sp. UC70_90]